MNEEILAPVTEAQPAPGAPLTDAEIEAILARKSIAVTEADEVSTDETVH